MNKFCYPNELTRLERADAEMYVVPDDCKRIKKMIYDCTMMGVPCRIYTTGWNPCAYIQWNEQMDYCMKQFPERIKGLMYMVHGGITFQGKLEGEEGTWLGWDYAHVGDYIGCFEGCNLIWKGQDSDDHKWSSLEILEDIFVAVVYCIKGDDREDETRQKFRNFIRERYFL